MSGDQALSEIRISVHPPNSGAALLADIGSLDRVANVDLIDVGQTDSLHQPAGLLPHLLGLPDSPMILNCGSCKTRLPPEDFSAHPPRRRDVLRQLL